jgi:hypothetical protein
MLIIKQFIGAVYYSYYNTRWDKEIAHFSTFCILFAVLFTNALALCMLLHYYNLDSSLPTLRVSSALPEYFFPLLLSLFFFLLYFLFKKGFPEKKLLEIRLSEQQQRWYEWVMWVTLLGPFTAVLVKVS